MKEIRDLEGGEKSSALRLLEAKGSCLKGGKHHKGSTEVLDKLHVDLDEANEANLEDQAKDAEDQVAELHKQLQVLRA